MQRVPVISPLGRSLMPTKPSRARRWLNVGKTKIYSNDLNVFAIQLISEPSGYETQDVVIGIDPGKLFSGVGVQSSQATLLKLHLVLPFPNVTKKMTARRILRRARRGRRINRKLPYEQRCHRAKRFNNRVAKKLPPSIRANRQLELRVAKEITRLFPVSHIVYEYIKARGNKGFSPAMVGQKVMLEWLTRIASTSTQLGWQTSNLRQWLKLPKDKADKSKACEETHSNDGVALAASHSMTIAGNGSGNSVLTKLNYLSAHASYAWLRKDVLETSVPPVSRSSSPGCFAEPGDSREHVD